MLSRETTNPQRGGDPGSPFAQAMAQLQTLEAALSSGREISGEDEKNLVGPAFAWLAAQLLVRQDEPGQRRLWDCWAQLGAEQSPESRKIGQEFIEQLETMGMLEQYGADGLELLRTACVRLKKSTQSIDETSNDSPLQSLVWVLLHLTERRWWAKLQKLQEGQRPLGWSGQENHLPRRLGRVLTGYMDDHQAGGSFRPALALNIIRSFLSHGTPDDTLYRHLVRDILKDGPNEFLPAETLPLILRMVWMSPKENAEGVDRTANEGLVFQMAVHHFLEKRPNDADLFFAPREDTTWERICSGQIFQTTVEPHFHKAWDQRWAASEQVPDPTGEDGVDHLVALYTNRMIEAIGLEALDRIPDDRRDWLVERMKVIQLESEQRQQRQQGARSDSILRKDTPAIRVMIEREALKKSAGLKTRHQRSKSGIQQNAPAEKPRHKM